MKTIKLILTAILLIPLILLYQILIWPLSMIMQIQEAISLRRFRKREVGRVYLICTAKRNWHDFLKNNVIPVLPDNIHVVWHKPTRTCKYTDIFKQLAHSNIFGIAKPYMVLVAPKSLLHQTLNTVLQPLKAHPKQSDDIRNASAEIIRKFEQELRSNASTSPPAHAEQAAQ